MTDYYVSSTTGSNANAGTTAYTPDTTGTIRGPLLFCERTATSTYRVAGICPSSRSASDSPTWPR